MVRSVLTLLSGALAAVVSLAAPDVAAARDGFVVGAVDEHVRASSLVEVESQMQLLRTSGFRAIRVTSYWQPGMTRLPEGEQGALERIATAGARNGVRIFVTVMHPGSRTTPLTDETRAQFASYAADVVGASPTLRDVIVGNEPNLNRFWLPQYGEDGSSASPAAYVALLARTYDALKAVSPAVRVYGGAVSPRGTDRPDGIRPTHSPTRFLEGLGAAYRASGRTQPVMDAFVIHPYGDNSSQPPSTGHPSTTSIGVADYDKLVALLGGAFDGTAQRGSDLPILYGEYGVETEIPPEKAGLYTGTEPATTRPVSEETQAAYYEQALALSYCQPNVEGLLVFLARDERGRAGWQSGLFYVDGEPKSSLPRVKRALDRAFGGSVARCPNLQLVVRPTFLRFGTRGAARRGVFRTSFRCNLDCAYRARLENTATGSTLLGKRGRSAAGELVQIDFGTRALRRGTYRYTLRLVHPVNPAPPTIRVGPQFRLP